MKIIDYNELLYNKRKEKSIMDNLYTLEKYTIDEEYLIPIPALTSGLSNLLDTIDPDAGKKQKLKPKSRADFLEFLITRMIIGNIEVCKVIIENGTSTNLYNIIAINSDLMKAYDTYTQYKFDNKDKIYLSLFLYNKLEILLKHLEEVGRIVPNAAEQYTFIHIKNLILMLNTHIKR